MRLDHLLSKELPRTVPKTPQCGLGGLQGKPVADTQVVRRVLMGGISTDSASVRGFPHASTVPLFGGCLERVGVGRGGRLLAHCWVLRQQDRVAAALAVAVPGLVFLVSWLHRSHGCSAPFGGGVCVGCVVRGCCLRTT